MESQKIVITFEIEKQLLLLKQYIQIQFFLCLLASLQGTNIQAQNLVPNPSFEEYSQCPDNENEIFYSVGWKSYYATPDYFNICATNQFMSIPNNFAGSYQQPATGVAYAGFFAYWSGIFSGGGSNMREHIGRQLSSPLVVGVKYFVSFKVSLAISTGGNANCAANNIGIKFSTVPYDLYSDSASSSPLTNNFAHVYDTTLITDTVNWTTIEGAFIADSAYNYIIIGNFFKDVNTDTLIYQLFPPPDTTYWCYSYYYVDDICVSTNFNICGVTGANETKIKDEIQIFPNPFSSITTVNLIFPNVIEKVSLQLFDVFGIEVKKIENNNSNKVIIDRNNLSNGIYLLKINVDNNIFTNKLIIN